MQRLAMLMFGYGRWLVSGLSASIEIAAFKKRIHKRDTSETSRGIMQRRSKVSREVEVSMAKATMR